MGRSKLNKTVRKSKLISFRCMESEGKLINNAIKSKGMTLRAMILSYIREDNTLPKEEVNGETDAVVK